MPIRIITVPFDPEHDLFQDEELVRFLLNKRVLSLHPAFFQYHNQPYWSVFVEYETLPAKGEISAEAASDLDETQRRLMERLRDWRREKAEQQGVPVYIIATNSQLEELVRRAPTSLEGVRQISGFGKKKVERHGKEMIDIIKGFYEPPKDLPPPKENENTDTAETTPNAPEKQDDAP